MLSSASGPDNARLRRAQALAASNQVGLAISMQLLDVKLSGQARVAAHRLAAPAAAERIEQFRLTLSSAQSQSELREIEAVAASTYFGTWTTSVALRWATRDQSSVPEHWKIFASRRTRLGVGAAANRATDPINAALNYLYALAETECRRACLLLGLDPGMGILHADRPGRDSLALDLIEVVRPDIEAYVLDLAKTHVFRRSDFIEREDGHCRLLAPLTHQLAETLPVWRQLVAPHAEVVAHALADSAPHDVAKRTPLTSAIRRRNASTAAASRRKPMTAHSIRTPVRTAPGLQLPRLPTGCLDCGAPLGRQRTYCRSCWLVHLEGTAQRGRRQAATLLDAPGEREERGRAIAAGKRAGRDRYAATLGLQPESWTKELNERLSKLTLAQIVAATKLSVTQASRLKSGRQQPHPRHWEALRDIASPT